MDPYGCVGSLDITVNAPAFVHLCLQMHMVFATVQVANRLFN